ncbi:Xylose operon regulatory protein [Pseudovibrio sp. Ad14]|nr:Xylose operon regulatory protein [Pseudovibrio sp. W74]KZL09502.1 Xylose operon regulatory protein [Pseudovibrio sp. Ad14]
MLYGPELVPFRPDMYHSIDWRRIEISMDIHFILDEMEIQAHPFALCELNGACDLDLDKDPLATLHYVLAGEGELVLPGRPAIPVSKGSLILVPALKKHVLRSFGQVHDPIPSCNPDKLKMAHLIHNSDTQDKGQLIAICSRISLSLRQMENLIDLVQEPIVENQAGEDACEAPIRRLLLELANPAPGSLAMVRALLMQCMIELMRRRFNDQRGGLEWMAALRDPRMWPVLRHILDTPGEPHSVESLASLAGMSRSGFAKRFQEAYGSGPMELLRDVRMRRAATMLLETDHPIERVSHLIGFRSRSAFSRAFEAAIGVSPQKFRMERKG